MAVVNQTLARRHFLNESPIGKTFSMEEEPTRWIQVIGIVQDTKYDNLRKPAPPLIYVPYTLGSTVGTAVALATMRVVASLLFGLAPPRSSGNAHRRWRFGRGGANSGLRFSTPGFASPSDGRLVPRIASCLAFGRNKRTLRLVEALAMCSETGAHPQDESLWTPSMIALVSKVGGSLSKDIVAAQKILWESRL